MKLLIHDIKIGHRFRKDLGDIKALCTSIQTVGLFHPVVINEKNELVAGYRRLRACRKMGWKEVPVTKVDLHKIALGEFHENVMRKDFTISEVVAIKHAIEPVIKKEAGQRKKSGKPSADSSGGETREIVAKSLGVSHDYLTKAETIVKAAKKAPAKYSRLLENVDAGETSVEYAYKVITANQRMIITPKLPDGKFDVIYADPPWEYDVKLRGDPQQYYNTMSIEQMVELNIPASNDAILFLWATNPMLQDAILVMKEWGFEYKTNMVWIKDRIGTGHWVRGKHELLLIGKKGKMSTPAESTRPESVIVAPRMNHSAKPEVVYNIIEAMYPFGKYLELFARKQRKGWNAWGAELL